MRNNVGHINFQPMLELRLEINVGQIMFFLLENECMGLF